MVVGFVTSRCLKSGFGTHFGRLYGFNFQLYLVGGFKPVLFSIIYGIIFTID